MITKKTRELKGPTSHWPANLFRRMIDAHASPEFRAFVRWGLGSCIYHLDLQLISGIVPAKGGAMLIGN